MENTITRLEINLVAPTRLKTLRKEFTARKRRLLKAQVRNLLFS
jgi:hypothetical protein